MMAEYLRLRDGINCSQLSLQPVDLGGYRPFKHLLVARVEMDLRQEKSPLVWFGLGNYCIVPSWMSCLLPWWVVSSSRPQSYVHIMLFYTLDKDNQNIITCLSDCFAQKYNYPQFYSCLSWWQHKCQTTVALSPPLDELSPPLMRCLFPPHSSLVCILCSINLGQT